MGKIRATVLGLRDGGESLCAAVCADPRYQLVAVTDRDSGRAHAYAAQHGVTAYDDHRSAVVESGAGALFVALPPHERIEYLKPAAQRGMAVLLTHPPVTRLEHAVELARLFAAHDATLSVVRFWQAEPAYARLGGIALLAGRLFSAHVNVLGPAGDLLGWRGDSGRAGGGVLLHQAYDPTDALVALFGVPEEVYAVLPRSTDTGEIRAHDTEDAVTLMLRFSGARVATMNCRRLGDEDYWRYRLHGARATVVITPEEMVVSATAQHTPSVTRVRTRNRFSPPVTAFGAALESNLAYAYSPIDAHFKTLAVIEAAYLSAKTGQPESPRRLYRIATGEEAD